MGRLMPILALGLVATLLVVGPTAANSAPISGTYQFYFSGDFSGDTSGSGLMVLDADPASPTYGSLGFGVSIGQLTGEINFLTPSGSGYSGGWAVCLVEWASSSAGTLCSAGNEVAGFGMTGAWPLDWHWRRDNTFSLSGCVGSECYQYGGTYSAVLVSAVPEPGTLALLGLGLVGMGYARRRKAS